MISGVELSVPPRRGEGRVLSLCRGALGSAAAADDDDNKLSDENGDGKLSKAEDSVVLLFPSFVAVFTSRLRVYLQRLAVPVIRPQADRCEI